MYIQDGFTVLFQGDSITDCGRDRANPDSLGGGYAQYVADLFRSRHMERSVRFLNKGISGDRVVDLQKRWQQDCLELKPDVLSILIGINDCWRRYDRNDPTSCEAYEQGFRDLLTQATRELRCKIVIIEPFLLPVDDKLHWHEDLDSKIQSARTLAREFGATYLPMDGLFAAASTQQPAAFWATDGVHPTGAGHMLIAREWLKALGSRG